MKFSKAKAFSTLFVLMLALCALPGIALPAQAVVGGVSTPITKAIVNVTTRYYFTGSGWTAGAPFWYQWGTSSTWTGGGISSGFSADSGGGIPSTAKLDLTATSTGTWYILLSQSSDGTAGVATVTITVKTTGPTFTIGKTEGKPGDTIEDITGSGFTVGQSVTLYLGTRALSTYTVGTDGTISGTFVVPDIARPTTPYGVWAVQTDGMSARYGTTAASYVSFTVNPKISVDRISTKGQVGETFVVTGRAWTSAETLSSPIVAGVTESFQPVTPAPTVTADGTFTATVYLSAAIGTYGPATIQITGSTTGAVSEANAIIVSTPDYPGDEGIALNYANRVVGKSVTVRLWNFPAGSSITVYLGGSSWGTTSADSNGAAKTDLTVPEMIGGTYAVTARETSGLRAIGSLTVDPKLELFFSDTGAKAYHAEDAKRPYVKKDTVLKLVGTGLGCSTEYTITDAGTDIVMGYYVTAVTKGELKAKTVKTTATGSMELTYKARSSTTTGTDVTVWVGTAISALFNGLGDPTLTISPDHGATTSSYTVTTTVTNIIPGKVYQVLLDGVAQVLSAGTDNYFVAEGTLGLSGNAPSPTTIVVPLNMAAGVHTIAIVYFGTTASLKDAKYIASTAGGTPMITLSKTSAKYDDKVNVYGFNFAASEAVTVRVGGITAISAARTADSDGSFRVEDPTALITGASYPNLPGGTYVVYADRTSGTEPSATLTISPGMAVSPSEGSVGDTIGTVTAYSLDPNTRYRLILDSTKTKDAITTDNNGYYTGTFTVAAVLQGKYALGWALETAPTTAIITKDFKVWDPADLSLDAASVVPLQQVKIKWKNLPGLSAPAGTVSVCVKLGDYTAYAGEAAYDATAGIIYAGFTMPNGAAELIKMTVIYADHSDPPATGTKAIVIKRIEGSGSLVLGTTADIAYIKTAVDSLAVSISSLDAKIVSVNGTTATISTKIGLLSADLATINTAVKTIAGDVVTVKTDLGTLSGKVVAVDGSVATIKTDVGTIKADVSTIKADTSTLKTGVTDIKGQFPIKVDMTPVWIAVVLSLVAALAAIVSVVQLSRKIAG